MNIFTEFGLTLFFALLAAWAAYRAQPITV